MTVYDFDTYVPTAVLHLRNDSHWVFEFTFIPGFDLSTRSPYGAYLFSASSGSAFVFIQGEFLPSNASNKVVIRLDATTIDSLDEIDGNIELSYDLVGDFVYRRVPVTKQTYG
jgi:hypothetical protein